MEEDKFPDGKIFYFDDFLQPLTVPDEIIENKNISNEALGAYIRLNYYELRQKPQQQLLKHFENIDEMCICLYELIEAGVLAADEDKEGNYYNIRKNG